MKMMKARSSMKPARILFSVVAASFLIIVAFSEISFLLSEDSPMQSAGRSLLQQTTGGTRTNPVTKETMSDKFCAIEPSGSTHCFVYLNWLIVTAGGPGIVLGALSFAGFFIYAIFHIIACGCCNFGATRCLPPPNGSKLRYWIAKFLVWGATIATIVILIFAFLSNRDVNGSVKSFEGTVVNTTIAFNNTINTIVTDLQPINGTKDILKYTTEAQGYVKIADQKTKSVSTQIDTYNGYRSIVFIVSFALPVGFGVLASIAGCFNIRILSVIIGFLLFFCSVLLWVTFAAHSSVTVAFDDVCKDILGLAGARSQYTNSTSIGVIVDCANGTNIFGDLIVYVNNATNIALNQTCDGVKDVCNRQYVYCNNSVVCGRKTLDQYKTAIISEPRSVQCRLDLGPTLQPICPYDPRKAITGCDQPANLEPCNFTNHTLESCPTECSNSDLRTQTGQIIQGLNTVVLYEKVIFEQVLPVLNCSIIEDAYDTLRTTLCTDLRGQSKKISIESALAAGFLVPMTIGALIGWLTYRKPDEEDTFELYDRK